MKKCYNLNYVAQLEQPILKEYSEIIHCSQMPKILYFVTQNIQLFEIMNRHKLLSKLTFMAKEKNLCVELNFFI